MVICFIGRVTLYGDLFHQRYQNSEGGVNNRFLFQSLLRLDYLCAFGALLFSKIFREKNGRDRVMEAGGGGDRETDTGL